jgi:hypothetical protein
MAYKIFSHFDKSDLEMAAKEKYYNLYEDPDRPCPVNKQGFCPLGLLLHEEHIKRPSDFEVAAILARRYGLPYLSLLRQASAFIRAWDSGKIEDLSKAMGLK